MALRNAEPASPIPRPLTFPTAARAEQLRLRSGEGLSGWKRSHTYVAISPTPSKGCLLLSVNWLRAMTDNTTCISRIAGQPMPEQQLSLELGRAGRDAALAGFERTRAEWLTRARVYAITRASFFGSVCADDVHLWCPIPEGLDPRVMGAVFMIPELVADGYVPTKRPEAHARPIRRFVLRERAVG